MNHAGADRRNERQLLTWNPRLETAASALRLKSFFQRFLQLAQIFFLFLGFVECEGAIIFSRDAANKMKGVSVPVVKLIAALIDFLPLVAHRTAMQSRARGKVVFFVAGVVQIFLRAGF